MKALSHRWAPAHSRLLSSTTDKAIRLAIALGAVKAAVRVVDRTVPPLSVDWAAVDDDAPVKSMSYTDIRGHNIRINPMPILDTGLDHGRALDVEIGFGLHEASHSQESRSRFEHLVKREAIKRPSGDPGASPEAARQYRAWDDLIKRESTIFAKDGNPTREVPAFEPMRVAAYLWNLVEDVRIEAATGKRWPGFRPYFGAVLDYMWSEMRSRHEMPTEYGPTLTEKLRVVFIACRYPEQAKTLDFNGPEMGPEREWWQAWQHDYLSDAVDTPTTIQRGLDHLGEDEATAAELDAEREQERAERERGEKLRAQLDRLIREGIEGGFAICIDDQGEAVPLDAETAEAVRQLVRENLVERKTVVTAVGAGNPTILVRKPEETRESRRAYVGRPNAEAEALRAALVFRPSAPQHDAKLLRAGQMDDEELYRWALGDDRVFSERVVESKPDVFMGLLVDMSGSMYGKKLTIAQRLAQLFVWAVHDQEGIQTQVWGHTADVEENGYAHVYRLWEQGDPLSRLGLIDDLPHANNADGHAIAYVVEQVSQMEQPEKVVIVLSDGLPSAENYGGKPAQQHIRSVGRWALSRGVRVIQVAIDPDGLRPADQAAMFGTDGWVGFTDYAALPRQIAGLLGRFL